MPTPASLASRMPWYSVLLACMLLQLILAPIFQASAIGLNGERVLGVITLLAAVLAVNVRVLAIIIVLPTLAFQVVADYSTSAYALNMAVALRFVFMWFVFGLVLWRVLHARRVTADIVAGVACAYVILGIVWGDLYVLVEQWRPGSFDIPDGFANASHGGLRAVFTYFSFITLTTVGYGEVHPTDSSTGALCIAEAVVGQLYLAIMISRMVGLQISDRTGAIENSN